MIFFRKKTRNELIAIIKKAVAKGDSKAYQKATKQLQVLNQRSQLQYKIANALSVGANEAANRFKRQLKAVK